MWQLTSCREFVTPFAAYENTRQINNKQVPRFWVLGLSASIAAACSTMRSRHVQLIVIAALPQEGQCIRSWGVNDNFTSEAAGRDVERRGEDYL